MDRFHVGATLMDAANCKGDSFSSYTLVYPNLLYPRENLAAKVRPAGWLPSEGGDQLPPDEIAKDEQVRLMTQRELAVQDKDVLYAPLHIDMSEYRNPHSSAPKKEEDPEKEHVVCGMKRIPSLDSLATISTRATLDSVSTVRSRTDTGNSSSSWRSRLDTQAGTVVEDIAEEPEEPEEVITTLMIGGLPCHLNLADLVNVIDEQGFGNSFNLLYLPRPKGLRTRNRSSQANKGYSFVNFKTPELAARFSEVFSKFAFQSGQLKKECYAKPALCQGYEANLKQYSAYPECCLLSF